MTQSDILRRAAERLGGPEHLATFLDVPAAEIGAWIDEERVPPDDVVAAAFDVIAEGTVKLGSQN
ncbi:MAG TPA: hypothetical protein VG591_11835 [Burkholderiales bacterium]|jgi:hypothetical protein|nr:hypothetical protein [Burkholderiales bacterium]